jgi:hypothetical protein
MASEFAFFQNSRPQLPLCRSTAPTKKKNLQTKKERRALLDESQNPLPCTNSHTLTTFGHRLTIYPALINLSIFTLQLGRGGSWALGPRHHADKTPVCMHVMG